MACNAENYQRAYQLSQITSITVGKGLASLAWQLLNTPLQFPSRFHRGQQMAKSIFCTLAQTCASDTDQDPHAASLCKCVTIKGSRFIYLAWTC